MLNLYREGKDGKTPMERLRGTKHERPIAEYGEQVLYMPLGDRPAFPEPRFLEGTWLGIDLRSGEVLIGTQSGVVRARSVKRRLEQERWDAAEALAIKGTPWDPTPGVDPDLVPTAVRRPTVAGDEAEPPPIAEPGMTGRRAALHKRDFEKFGFTAGCPACANIERNGNTRVGHNELCRKRIEAELMKTEEGKQRVEDGYARLANAAMRVAERSAPQLPPPGGNGDKPEESEPPRKRGREASTSSGPVSGSTEELPPGTDEAGMGAEQDQEAPGTPRGRNPQYQRPEA